MFDDERIEAVDDRNDYGEELKKFKKVKQSKDW